MNNQLRGFAAANTTLMSPDIRANVSGSYFDRGTPYVPHNALIDSSFQHFNDTYFRIQQPEEILTVFHAGFTGPDQMEAVMGRLLPPQETTKEKFVVKMYYFDFVNMDVVPPGAIPDQQTAHMEEYNVRLNRYGQQFEMFDEELTTSEGYGLFLGHVAQQSISRFTTFLITGMYALTDERIKERSDVENFGDPENTPIDESLRKRAQGFGSMGVESQSSVQTISSHIQIGQSIISKLSGMKPENLILPPGSDILLQQTKPEQTYYFEYEGLNPTPRVVMGLNSPLILPNGIATFIAALPRLSGRQDNSEFDVLKQHSVIGEYYLMNSDPRSCDDKGFVKDKRNIQIFDIERNDWIEVPFRDAVLKSKVFKVADNNPEIGYDWDDEFKSFPNHGKSNEEMFVYNGLEGPQLIDYILQMSGINGENGAKRTAEHLLSKFLSEYNTVMLSAEKVLSDASLIIKKIAQQVPTANYVSNAGATFLQTGAARAPLQPEIDRMTKKGVPVMNVTDSNTNGGVKINNNASLPATMDYPAGLVSYSNLKSITEYAGIDPKVNALKEKLKAFIDLIDNLTSFLKRYLPHSELLDAKNIQPWIHSDMIGNVLVESMFGRFSPILIAGGGANNVTDSFKGKAVSPESLILIGGSPELQAFLTDRINENDSYPVEAAVQVISKFSNGNIAEFFTKYNANKPEGQVNIAKKIYNEAVKIKPAPAPQSGTVFGTYAMTGIEATPGFVTAFENDKTNFGNYIPADLHDMGATANVSDLKKSVAFANVKSRLPADERHADLRFLYNNIGTQLPISKPFSFKSMEGIFDTDSIQTKKIGVSFPDSMKKIRDDQFVGGGFTNVKSVDTIGGTLLGIVLHVFLTCRNVPDTLMRLLENEIYVPFNALLTRPQIRVDVSGAILSASRVGKTYYLRGQVYNPVNENGKRRYTIYLKFGCVVDKPDAVFYIPAVKFSGYHGGLSSEFFEYDPDRRALKNQIDRSENSGQSLISMLVPPEWKPASEILFLTDIKARDKKSKNIPSREYYDYIWEFTPYAAELAGAKRMEKNVFYSLFRGTYFRWDHSKECYSNDCLINGTGHLRGKVYVGCKAAFDGNMLFLRDPKLK